MASSSTLQQYINDIWHPISFFSRKMTPVETRYSTFDQEQPALYLSIKHFRHFLEGRTFHVLTDHKPLTYALNSRPDRYSPRQTRQLDYIAQFTSTIRHVHGTDKCCRRCSLKNRNQCSSIWQWLPPNPQIQPSAHSSPHKHPLSSSKLSHLLTLLTLSTVTLLLALKDPLYHNLGVALYSTLYTDSLILVFVPPKTDHFTFSLAWYSHRCLPVDSFMYMFCAIWEFTHRDRDCVTRVRNLEIAYLKIARAPVRPTASDLLCSSQEDILDKRRLPP